MAYGGSAFLGYDLIREFLVHHDENNLRPKVIDHLIAMSILGTVSGLVAMNTLRGAFQGFLFIGINGGMITYWLSQCGMRPLSTMKGSPHFYYEKDVTPEERERIEMMD